MDALETSALRLWWSPLSKVSLFAVPLYVMNEQSSKRKWWRWLIAFVFLLPVMLFLMGLALYIPIVQDWAVGLIESRASTALGMRVEVGQLRLTYPLDLSLRQVYLIPNPQDTLLSLGRVDVSVSPRPLLDKRAVIPHLTLEALSYHQRDSLGGITRLGLGHAKLQDFSLDLDKKLVGASRLEGDALDLYYHTTDTTSKSDTTKVEWLIHLQALTLRNSKARVSMPMHAVMVDTEFKELGLRNVDLNLGESRYALAKAHLSDARLDYAVDSVKSTSPFMDYGHISTSELNLRLSRLLSHGSLLDLEVEEGRAKERSGFEIKALRGEYYQDSLRMRLSRLQLQTSHSSVSGDVDIPWLIFRGDTTALLTSEVDAFVGAEDVRLLAGAKISEEKTYRYITQALAKDLAQPIALKVSAIGTLNDMEVAEGSLVWQNLIDAEIRGRLRYLLHPKLRRGKLLLKAQLESRAEKLLYLIDPNLSKSYRLPAGLSLEGDVDLSRDHYQLDALLSHGNSSADIIGLYNATSKRYQLDLGLATFAVNDFVLGSDLATITANLRTTGQGFDPLHRTTTTQIEGRITEAVYRGKTYQDISLDGKLRHGELSLMLNSFNPGLDFSLVMDGLLSRDRVQSSLNLVSQDIDLKALGLSDVPLGAKFDLEGELRSDLQDEYKLTANLRNVGILLDEDSIKPEQIHLIVDTDKEHSRVSLNSGDLSLKTHIAEAPSSLGKRVDKLTQLYQTLAKEIQSLKPMQLRLERVIEGLPALDLDLELGKENALRSYLAKSRLAAESVVAHMRLRPRVGLEGHLTARDLRRDTLRINCIDLALSTERIPRVQLRLGEQPDSMRINMDLRVDKRRFRQQAGFSLSASVNASLQDASISTLMLGERDEVQHKLSLLADWSSSAYQLHLLDEEATIGGQVLRINSGNWMNVRKEDYFFSSDIRLEGQGNARLTLLSHHEASKQQEATLSLQGIRLEDYQALGFSSLQGTLGGDINYLRVGGIKEQPTINGDLAIQDLSYDDKQLGHFATAFFYEPRNDDSHYITADVSYRGNQALSINAVYSPKLSDGGLSGSVSLKQFPLEVANPFSAPYATYLAGSLNGSLDLSGKLTSPILRGELLADKGEVELREYATTLKLDTLPLRFEGHQLRFDNYTLYSGVDKTHPLYLDGTIGLSGKEMMQANLSLNTDELMLMNQTRPNNEAQVLYGRLIASANMRLTGKLNALKVRGQLGINSGTNCTYMMRESTLDASDKAAGLISFVDFADTVFMTNPVTEAELGGIDLSMNVKIDPSVRFNVDLTADGRDYMRMQGGGNLQLRYAPYGELSVRGRYDMSGGGTLQYTLPVVGSKLFNIDPSGYIVFDGNVRNPYVDFIATQKLRASTGDNTGGKTNFNVSIKMKNRIEDINLSFDLSAPENLSVQNSLASMSSEERGKQAIGLLATGTFLGANNGSNISLNETFAALLQNQINTVAGNLLSGTDLSLGMEMSDGTTGNQYTSYTYSFSRRFYNDRIRVVVGGKVQTGATTSAREQSLIDNVAMEYQLDKAGERFVRVYYKRVTDNVIEGEYNETGLGVLLRRKLSRLDELFRFKKPQVVKLDSLDNKPVIKKFTLPVGQ